MNYIIFNILLFNRCYFFQGISDHLIQQHFSVVVVVVVVFTFAQAEFRIKSINQEKIPNQIYNYVYFARLTNTRYQLMIFSLINFYNNEHE